jgi:hypothetical protein
VIVALAAAASAASTSCAVPIANADRMDTKVSAYAKRSVGIIALAQHKDKGALDKLVSPEAKFNIGSADLGRDLGTGVDGIMVVGQELEGYPLYRFRNWSGPPPGADDPCSPIKVEVEFSTRDRHMVVPITFSYDHGLLQAAQGWHGYDAVGEIDAVKP